MSSVDRQNSTRSHIDYNSCHSNGDGIVKSTTDCFLKRCKTISLRNKVRFLKTCIKNRLLLPSNKRKGIDLDLLLEQQSRNLTQQFLAMEEEIKSCRVPENVLTSGDLAKLKAFEQVKKKFYVNRLKEVESKQNKNVGGVRMVNNKTTTGAVKSRNRKSRIRYKRRKAYFKRCAILERASKMILNKSNIPIEENDKILLMRGLNFAPTPNWSSKIEEDEWQNHFLHIRRIEWDNIFEGEEEAEGSHIPPKLVIPKISRPPKDRLDEETKIYTGLVEAKLRNIKDEVRKLFKKQNNLSKELQQSLTKLKKLVNDRKLVICKADKDGKIILLNYEDYDNIMVKQLDKFERMEVGNHNQYFTKIRTKCEEKVKRIFEEGVINKDLLLHSTGLKFQNQYYHKLTGPLAKHFTSTDTAYAYPLFKTHKLDQ